MLLHALTCLLAMLAFGPTTAEYYSSVEQLQSLATVETNLLDLFQNHMAQKEIDFQVFQNFIDKIKAEHEAAANDMEDYLGNPINAFKTIKRLVTEWPAINNRIQQTELRGVLQTKLQEMRQAGKYPEEKELQGAVKGLSRLQKTYNLKSNDLATGLIYGEESDVLLSWHDCFEIASTLFEQKEISLAISWFETTVDKIKAEPNGFKDITLKNYALEALELLSLAHYELGSVETALDYNRQILEIEADHTVRDTQSFMEFQAIAQITNASSNSLQSIPQAQNDYARLCQGILVEDNKQHKLKCHLKRHRTGLFALAPFKMEEISLDPVISVYHGLLNEAQIQAIWELAQPSMERSKVRETAESAIVGDYRVSQHSFLNQWENVNITKLYKMVKDLTGLGITQSENMQVANYGIGGQYEPHYDFMQDVLPEDWKSYGDRIATCMFYLSDVELGGYTVFPHLNVFVTPIKGSMVMWYNLHKSLDVDARTLHAGCPVIRGSKKIGNVWLHSQEQDIARPCGLKRDNNKSKKYII